MNNRATEQSYALAADVPTGWQATFTPSGETTNVASLTVDAGQSQGVTVTVTPPDDVEKGDYSIPVTAISSEDNLPGIFLFPSQVLMMYHFPHRTDA